MMLEATRQVHIGETSSDALIPSENAAGFDQLALYRSALDEVVSK